MRELPWPTLPFALIAGRPARRGNSAVATVDGIAVDAPMAAVPAASTVAPGVAVEGIAVRGALPGDLDAKLFPADIQPFLNVLAQLGLVLFMFLVGLEVDARAEGLKTGLRGLDVLARGAALDVAGPVGQRRADEHAVGGAL